VTKLRADLEKANRKAEDQDYALQKIDAKLGAFDEIFKKLASFVSIRCLISVLIGKLHVIGISQNRQ
jgi:hypothetical protein